MAVVTVVVVVAVVIVVVLVVVIVGLTNVKTSRFLNIQICLTQINKNLYLTNDLIKFASKTCHTLRRAE